MPPRHFTRDEVNALLIEVQPLTEKLVAHRAALVERSDSVRSSVSRSRVTVAVSTRASSGGSRS